MEADGVRGVSRDGVRGKKPCLVGVDGMGDDPPPGNPNRRATPEDECRDWGIVFEREVREGSNSCDHQKVWCGCVDVGWFGFGLSGFSVCLYVWVFIHDSRIISIIIKITLTGVKGGYTQQNTGENKTKHNTSTAGA